MNGLKGFFALGLILASECLLSITASELNRDKEQFGSLPISDDFDIEARDVPPFNDDDTKANLENVDGKSDPSKGRLFFQKFLLFRNLFNANQQPVIPIIITGGATSPTTTTTGTIPTATGTLTVGNNPAGNRIRGRLQPEAEGSPQVPQSVDIQALQAALAAGAGAGASGGPQEYAITDQEIKGTLNSQTTHPNNVRNKNAQKDQIIQLRIPPKYRQFFKSGQKLNFNVPQAQKKRNIFRRRANKNQRRVNRNQNL